MSVSEYELVLMLDPEESDERRDEIASNARKRIESGGSLKADSAWGMRKLAYEIRQRTEADYRFFRFETESPLLNDLDHTLKITDGVLRFRIFKVDPESPVIEPPPPVSLASSAGRGPRDRRPPRADYEDLAPAEVATVTEAAPEAPAAPEGQAVPEEPVVPDQPEPAEEAVPEAPAEPPADEQ
jgi:small subunit ribosomal protein S6